VEKGIVLIFHPTFKINVYLPNQRPSHAFVQWLSSLLQSLKALFGKWLYRPCKHWIIISYPRNIKRALIHPKCVEFADLYFLFCFSIPSSFCFTQSLCHELMSPFLYIYKRNETQIQTLLAAATIVISQLKPVVPPVFLSSPSSLPLCGFLSLIASQSPKSVMQAPHCPLDICFIWFHWAKIGFAQAVEEAR